MYQAPELFIAPPRCTPASDVYAFAIVLNEALTRQKPLGHMHATMLPVQVCGGLRPSPVYGDSVSASACSSPTLSPVFAAGVTEARQNHAARTTSSGPEVVPRESVFTFQLPSQASPVMLAQRSFSSDSCSDETAKRLRHLIRTGWEGKAKERPNATSVLKTVTRLLDGLGGPFRDEVLEVIGHCNKSTS